MLTGAEMTQAQVDCISDAFTDEVIEDMLVQSLAGENTDTGNNALFAAMLPCLTS